jgi:hypothetical protein
MPPSSASAPDPASTTTPPRIRGIPPLRATLSIVIAIALVWALMAWGSVSATAVWDTVSGMPLASFSIALAIHCGIYALRSWRFRVLIPGAPPPSFAQAYVIGAAHNLATYVLPAKAGEATWVVYLSAQTGVSAAIGLASLVVARLLDLAVLCGELGLVCLVLALSDAYGELLWLGPLGALLLGRRFQAGERIAERLLEVALALRSAAQGRRLWTAALLTVPQWLGIFAFYAVLARGMGLPDGVSFVEACFGSSLAVLSNLLPINGFAGFGTQEGGWVLGYGVVGVGKELALPTALGVHLVQLFDTVVLGVLAHLVMGFLWRGGARAGTPAAAPETDAE